MLTQYQNGNVLVSLFEDGTRHLEYEETIQLEAPLNLDIRVTNRCSNGYNRNTFKAICSYCHESATVDGAEGDYFKLMEKLENLNPGIELAIGGNEINIGLVNFLEWATAQGFIVNLTVNQLHIPRYSKVLKSLIDRNIIKGLGISYRKDYSTNIDPFFIEYPNTVLHCIAGIDTVNEILESPFNKILCLGYKVFGLGISYFSPEIEKGIRQWQMYLPKLFGKKIVSFDNLAIKQLKVDRFFSKANWDIFYQGEYSFYINAVDGYFSPSSRSPEKTSWDNIPIKDYFSLINH